MHYFKYKNALTLSIMLLMLQTAHAEGWYVGAAFGSSDTGSDLGDITENATGFRIDESEIILINTFPNIDANFNLDDGDSGYKIYGGKDINEHFAYEFGFTELGDIGVLNFSYGNAGGPIDVSGVTLPSGSLVASGKESADGIYITAIAKKSLSESLKISGRIGLYRWDYSRDIVIVDTTGFFPSSTESISDSGSDLLYGLGLHIKSFALIYESYEVNNDDVSLTGISGNFRF